MPEARGSRPEFPDPTAELTFILVAADPGRSRQWYEDILGAEVYRAYDTSVVLRFLGAWLLVVEGGPPTDDKPSVTLEPPAHPNVRDNLFTIRVADCESAYEQLRARGAAFLTPPVRHGNETRCFLRDPDGHLFELSEYRSSAS